MVLRTTNMLDGNLPLVKIEKRHFGVSGFGSRVQGKPNCSRLHIRFVITNLTQKNISFIVPFLICELLREGGWSMVAYYILETHGKKPFSKKKLYYLRKKKISFRCSCTGCVMFS